MLNTQMDYLRIRIALNNINKSLWVAYNLFEGLLANFLKFHSISVTFFYITMTCSMITCHFWGETVINRNFSSMATGFHFKFEMDFEKG